MATAVVNGECASGRRRLALPQLSGWALRAYQGAWVVAALLAVASCTVFAYRWEVRDQAVNLAIYDTGLLPFSVYADGTHVSPFSAESHVVGVRPDDAIIQIDGRPAPSYFDLTPILGGPDGSRVNLTLRAPDSQVRNVSLTRNRSYLRDAYRGAGINWTVRRWMEFALQCASSLLLLAVATLLFTRRPRDPVAAMLSLGTVLNLMNLESLNHALLIPGLALLSISLGLIILGVLFFPNGQLTPRWWPAGAVAAGAAVVALFTGNWVIPLRTATPFFGLTAFGLAAAAVVTRFRAAPAGQTRQQIKFAMLGFIGFIFLFLAAMAFNQGVVGVADEGLRAWLIVFRSLARFLANMAFAAGLLISLLRYRLYDAETAIGRSAAYGVLTLGFVALFAGTEKLAEIIGERYFEHSIGIAAGAIGAAIAAACVVPLHNRVHRWAERRFQKPLIRLREGLPDCVADLRDTASVEQIAQAVMKRVEAGVRSTRGAVLLRDGGALALAGERNAEPAVVRHWQAHWSNATGEHTLDCDRHDPLFPLRVRLCIETADDPETIGWLLLGPRPDGSFFGKDEREALAHVAGPVARAIHIAQVRQVRGERAEQRLSALEALVTRLLGKDEDRSSSAIA
jgi:hypothetical protein